MGSTAIINMIGKKFGRWRCLSFLGTNKDGSLWKAVCDCGTVKIVRGISLRKGDSRSCGCIQKSHRYKGTRTYSTWVSMKTRCLNKNIHDWHRYGGRGIRICERWKDFRNFLADMGERPSGMQLDRVNNDGNYEPGNCRWATVKEQANNRRSNRLLFYRGQLKSLQQWASIFNINQNTLQSRIVKWGWSIEEALERPIIRPGQARKVL